MNLHRIEYKGHQRYCLDLNPTGEFVISERDHHKERRIKVNLGFCQSVIDKHATVFADRIKNHLDTMQRNGNKNLVVMRNWNS